MMSEIDDIIPLPNALEVFAILDKQKIGKIMTVLDESIIIESLEGSRLTKLKNMGFTGKQAAAIMECFWNFYYGLRHPDKIKTIIEQQGLNDDTRKLILDTFYQVLKRGDKEKIRLNMKSETARQFGHAHLVQLEIMPEFRPIIIDGKLEKIIVSIVINGHTHDDQYHKIIPINFQIDIDKLKKLIHKFDNQIQEIETTIKALSTKLGRDVVIG